jgi:hypothetical protein
MIVLTVSGGPDGDEWTAMPYSPASWTSLETVEILAKGSLLLVRTGAAMERGGAAKRQEKILQ